MAGSIPSSIVEHVYDPSVTFLQGPLQTGKALPPRRPKRQYEQQKAITYDKAPQPLKQGKIQVGKDGRQRITQTTAWPQSIHAQLTIVFEGKIYGGSGVMVGPQHLLSSGSNIYDSKEKKWADRITVFPGLNDDQAPFGEVKVVKVCVYSNWTNGGDTKFDIAVLILDQAIGKYTGWGGIVFLSDQELAKEEVQITGYPGDKGLKQMWMMSQKLKSLPAEELNYERDVDTAQSGGAIWLNKWGMPLILGVHTQTSSGVRLGKQKLTDMFRIFSETHQFNKSSPPLLACPKPPSRVYSALPGDKEGRERALREAAAQGDQEVVEHLLAKGTDVDARDRKGETPLMLACENGHGTIAYILVYNGAWIDSKREEFYVSERDPQFEVGKKAISIAVIKRHFGVVQMLLEEGVDGEARELMEAIGQQVDPAFLVNKKKVLLTPKGRERALREAASEGDEVLVKQLLHQGTYVNAKNRKGETPLWLACANGHDKIVDVLIDHKASIDERDRDGRSPISIATMNRHLPLVKKLLRKGARLTNPSYHLDAFGAPIDIPSELMAAISSQDRELAKAFTEQSVDLLVPLKDPGWRDWGMTLGDAVLITIIKKYRNSTSPLLPWILSFYTPGPIIRKQHGLEKGLNFNACLKCGFNPWDQYFNETIGMRAMVLAEDNLEFIQLFLEKKAADLNFQFVATRDSICNERYREFYTYRPSGFTSGVVYLDCPRPFGDFLLWQAIKRNVDSPVAKILVGLGFNGDPPPKT